MKVRKLAVALALAGGLGSGFAQALGLGEIELQSYLNEPLDAEINLRKSEGVSPGDVFVNVAPQSAFDRVGIARSFFLTKLNFQVTTAPDGNLVVNVSTREPLREPYLNFLVEVTWPNGRLMREYAVLVDPPVYAEESGVQEQVAAPASGQRSQPQARQQAPAEPARSATQTRTQGARTLGPTNSADTLWTIAVSVRPNNSVTTQQVMLALQDLNPDAFIDDNINRLKRGEILRVPEESQIRSRSRAEANREVARQNRALNTPERTVDATDGSTDGPTGDAASDGDQLRLLAADNTTSRDTSEGGSAGGDGDATGGVDAGSAVAMEELESARRENDELSGRVDDLQDQVQTLQRLLELKNSQLAQMQNTPDESTEQTTASDPADVGTSADGIEAGTSQEAMDETGAVDATETSGAMPEAESDAEPADTAESAETAEMPEQQSEAAADGQQAAQEPEQQVSSEPAAPAPAAKPFPGNVIDAIANNFIYQVALGGGLVVLLLLLLLLARRNANREKAFYEQLGGDADGDGKDSFDLTFDEEDDVRAPEEDAIAEADAYIAYGRNDQAAQALETAISREPSRSDLRLKLLGVYADIQDRESFDKQFREIEALDDEAATAEALSLQNRLDESESMPSIDDLESQLRSSGPGEDSKASYESDYQPDRYEETDFEDMDLDLDLPETDEERPKAADSAEDDSETDGFKGDEVEPGSEDDADDLIEYDLSEFEKSDDADLELDSELESDRDPESDDEFNFSLEEDDLPQGEETDEALPADDDKAPAKEKESVKPENAGSEADESDTDEDGELDESFLDELDAELDKVAGEDELPKDGNESELDDLELDVSDEDLALMEEFSENDDESPSDAPEKAEDDDRSLDEELGLEDTLADEPSDPVQEVEGAEEANELLSAGEPGDNRDGADKEDDSVAPPVASDRSSGRDSERDIDESDLGDDDDFDFLTGTDEAATKLDLARAYVEMGDMDGARDILEEVSLEGNEEQKAEAQDLLKNLS